MRVFKVPGYRKKVRLPERDYKRLLERFDATKAKFDSGSGEFIIQVVCICEFYDHNCGVCPFGRVMDIDTACVPILGALKLSPDYAYLCTSDVSWSIGDDKPAREELKAIRDTLLSLPRTG